MKSLLTTVAGGTALASFLLLLAAAVLVLVVIPVGLGILTLELERLKRGSRRFFPASLAQGRGKLLGVAPIH